jgi:hypothetical protein
MDKANLVTVGVETQLGAKYVFPDVELEKLEEILPKMKSGLDPVLSMRYGGQLVLVNASIAVLSMPFRIVEAVTVNGEQWWNRPSSAA